MLLVTFEILAVVVMPLLVLVLKGRWPMRVAIPALFAIPVLWYLTYAPIHELSHVLGTWVAGGSVTQVKLIPSFWHGEFARAWITPVGLVAPWQRFVMTSAPYALDGLSVAVGYFVLHRGGLLRRPFALGIALMLLCLRPAFDVLCESVGLARGARGDLWHLAQSVGYPAVWASMALLLGFALATIGRLLAKSAAQAEAEGAASPRRTVSPDQRASR